MCGPDGLHQRAANGQERRKGERRVRNSGEALNEL